MKECAHVKFEFDTDLVRLSGGGPKNPGSDSKKMVEFIATEMRPYIEALLEKQGGCPSDLRLVGHMYFEPRSIHDERFT